MGFWHLWASDQSVGAECGKLRVAQLHFSSGDVFFEVRNAGGAGDEDDVWAASQQPREGDLPGCGAEFPGDLRD